MSSRVGVEDDHIVEVGRHLFQALDNVVDNLDDPPGRSAAALGHGEPLIEAVEMQNAVGGTVSLCAVS